MGFILCVAVGGLMGWLAGTLLPREERRKRYSLPLGMLGGLMGGFMLGPLLGGGNLFEAVFYPMTVLDALLGAVILLAIVNMFRRRRAGGVDPQQPAGTTDAPAYRDYSSS